tara:strand:- start:1630 stop:2235 length:606 start_codon:yes stop_codon:yes gene_type:complete
MSLNKSLFIIFIGSLLFAQKFDPKTGEVIESDSLQVKFNPETGETFDFNTTPSKKFNFLEDWEVKDLAIRHAFQNYKEEELTYIAMGGPAALSSILPTIWLSMGLGGVFLNDEGLGLGFVVGSTAGILLNPRIFASFDSKPRQLVLLKKRVQDLDDNQRNLYIKEYSKHLISSRIKGIYKGEFLSMGVVLVSIIFLSSVDI